jgi:hypothetical protein
MRTKYLSRCISAFVAGIFLKLRTSHSPRVRHKPCRLYLGFHWRDFHYVIPRIYLLMRCTRCMFGFKWTFFLFVWNRNRNDHAILCMVLYNSLLLLRISTCHFPKGLTFVYDCYTLLSLCLHWKPFNFQQNKFEDFYSAIELNMFQL